MFTVAMNIFPPEKLGTAMGACSLVIMFAPAVGPTLTGLILAKLSWHWIFWLFVPFLLIALFFDLKFLPNISKLTREPVDFLAVILSACGFGLVVMGFSFAARFGWTSIIVLGCLPRCGIHQRRPLWHAVHRCFDGSWILNRSFIKEGTDERGHPA